jgi:hypothetical protein
MPFAYSQHPDTDPRSLTPKHQTRETGTEAPGIDDRRPDIHHRRPTPKRRTPTTDTEAPTDDRLPCGLLPFDVFPV